MPKTCIAYILSIVFWLGDLNYRLSEIENESVKQLVTKREFSKLMKYDQVSDSVSKGNLLIQPHLFQLLPSATVVAERLCFHRCLSVHRGGEVYTPRADRHPPGRHNIPPGHTPQVGTHPLHLGRHPSPPSDGHSSG